MRLIDTDESRERAVKVCFPDTPECGARMVNYSD